MGIRKSGELRRYVPFALLAFLLSSRLLAQLTYSIGILGGVTTPYTWDTGVLDDPRYSERYDIKFAPFTFHLGVDKSGYGFMVDPGIFQTGQHFHVINTVGGVVGTRSIDMMYAHVPFSFKLHVIDLSFFKISATANLAFAYLLNAEETVHHRYARLTFPEEVYPIIPDDYVIEYDGVLSPETEEYRMLEKSDFNPFQVYGGVGIRSDWDVGEHLRLSMDFRANYGLFEPRTSAYLDKVSNFETLYDLGGNRRDLYATLQVGVCRYIDIDRHALGRKKSRLHNERMPNSHAEYKKPNAGAAGSPVKQKKKKRRR